jgi:hypothetical protein
MHSDFRIQTFYFLCCQDRIALLVFITAPRILTIQRSFVLATRSLAIFEELVSLTILYVKVRSPIAKSIYTIPKTLSQTPTTGPLHNPPIKKPDSAGHHHFSGRFSVVVI